MLKKPTFRVPFAISLGAIVGALCRYYLGIWSIQFWGTSFPYGTLLINLSGCFLMGFFITLSSRRVVAFHPEIQLLVATGFLGSYTTFSTYGLDAEKLLARNLIIGTVYWAVSALFGVLSFLLGVMLAELIHQKSDRDPSD